MKTRKLDDTNKSGAILAMVMMVMLLFIILSSGLYKLHEQDAVETVYVGQSKLSFWAAESGLQDDGAGDAERGRHDDHAQGVGHQVVKDDAPIGGAQAAGRLDELAAAQRQHLRPHQAGDGQPVR